MTPPLPVERAPLAPLHAGASVGPYVLRRELRRTVVGSLWLAHEVGDPGSQSAVLGRKSAVLVLPDDVELDPGFCSLVAHRLESLGRRKSHPGIARSLAIAPGTRTAAPYVAMEFPGEKTLADVDRERRAQRGSLFTTEELRAIASQAGDALDHAHRLGVRHGAFGPDCVWILEDETSDVSNARLRVSEFVVTHAIAARMAARARSSKAAWAGSVRSELARYEACAAPELLEMAEPTPRSDVYSLGATLYCLSTGVAPFPGTEIEPPDTGDAALDLAVQRALASDPDERFASVAEMLAACEITPAAPSAIAAEESEALQPTTLAAGRSLEPSDVGMRTIELTPFQARVVVTATDHRVLKQPASRQSVAVAVFGWVAVASLGLLWYLSGTQESPALARLRAEAEGYRAENTQLRDENQNLRTLRRPTPVRRAPELLALPLAAPLHFGRTPVARGEFRSFCEATGRPMPEQPPGSDESPVVNVSWHEASAFCRWLGADYRLPHASEWEAARRAEVPSASPAPMFPSIAEWTEDAADVGRSGLGSELRRLVVGAGDGASGDPRGRLPSSRGNDVGFRVVRPVLSIAESR